MQEAIDLWKANKNADELAGTSTAQTKDELLNQLLGEKLLTAEEKTKLAAGETITIGNKNITLAKTLIEQFNAGEIKIGDYVDYTPVAGSTSVTKEETGCDAEQSYTVDTTTTWRVLGLSEDGKQLMITTGSPIKKEGSDPYLYLNSAEGWYNTNDELVPNNNILDKICEIYDGKYASSTKSMRIEDINNALGLTLDKAGKSLYKKEDTEKANPLTAFMGMFGTSYTYKAGDYAPENYLKQKDSTKYSTLTNKKIGDKVDGSAYMYQYTDSSIVYPSSKLYEFLFK